MSAALRESLISPGVAGHRGRFVLYWMQQAQRSRDNHALEAAVRLANEAGLPCLVLFVVTDAYPYASERLYHFMLEGLVETGRSLAGRGLRLLLLSGDPPARVTALCRESAVTVMDRGYTRVQRQWRSQIAAHAPCPLLEVDTDVVVPVTLASSKEEYGAYTLRPRLHRLMRDFLIPVEPPQSPVSSRELLLDGDPLPLDVEAILARLDLRPLAPVAGLQGGSRAARERLEAFLDSGLARYHEQSRDPNAAALSGLSPYLHFGQISPLTVAMQVAQVGGAGADAFLEQLIVRRELAVNFTWYSPVYDSIACLPDWARASLMAHRHDQREYVYTHAEWEQARTHDPYWNAAQNQLRVTGSIHGYMRMYWGKKLLEWSSSPEEAWKTALILNDTYALDGRDPNGYAGVAWCFGKHDRPWQERPVFGKIRYMNDTGLRRKFDADAYVRDMAALAAQSGL